MNIPADLRYTESHEWIRAKADGTLTIGITDYAAESLGDIVFVELPAIGKRFSMGEPAAVIESVKAASDIYAPVSSEVIAINEALKITPEQVNADPYHAWLFQLKPTADDNGPLPLTHLLTAHAYRVLIGS